MPPPDPSTSPEDIRAVAARWVVLRDRGLSSAESVEYELWLAADERHAAAAKRAQTAWSLLDRIPEPVAQPSLRRSARARGSWPRRVATASLLAAGLALAGFAWKTAFFRAPDQSAVVTSGPHKLALPDGTLVHLNTGAAVQEKFTADERRVVLLRGEVHFSVTKNPARPFVVEAGALRVRAVGTAFDINLQGSGVDVIVTEGRVQLNAALAGPALSEPSEPPALDAGQRAELRAGLAPAANLADALVITRLDPTAMERALSWREPLLRFGGATLAEIAVEFERATGRRLILADPSLANLRFGGRFRADDIDGFTHLLTTTLELEMEKSDDGAIVLRKKK